MRHAQGAGRAEAIWSFGGTAAIETAVGVLYPSLLVAATDHAFLDASLTPFGGATTVRGDDIVGAVALTDDQGATYALRVEAISGNPLQGQERGLVSLRLGVDPVPARERGWLELRGQHGSAARLFVRPVARASRLAPVPASPVGRQLSNQALMLIGVYLSGADQNAMQRYCSALLARAAQAEQSGPPVAAGDLPGNLARLCAVLTGHGSADELPREWSSIISAAKRTDGAQRHVDISADLPPVDGVAVRVDRLVSEPGSWGVYLTSEPGWWAFSADRRHKRALMSVHAEDDLGGIYVSQFGGSTENGNRAEVTLKFLPRLDPRARALTLTFTGRDEQVALELFLP